MNKVIVFLALYLTYVAYAVPIDNGSVDNLEQDLNSTSDPEFRNWFNLFGFKPNHNEIYLEENDLDDFDCPALPKINQQLQGDVEQRTIGLDGIPKINFQSKYNKRLKYEGIMNMFRLFNFSTNTFFDSFLSQAEKMKKIVKEQKLKFLAYMRLIQNRVEKTLGNPMGPEIVHLLLTNTKITLKSNAQIDIVRNSLKTLVKCYNAMKPNIKNLPYIKYAKKILNYTMGYNHINLKETVKANQVFDEYEIKRRIIIDAKLTEFEDPLMNFRIFNWFADVNEDEEDEVLEEVNDDKSNELKNEDNLKVASHFDKFVSIIIDYIKSIKYNLVHDKCKIKDIDGKKFDQIDERKPTINADDVVDKKTIEMLQKKTEYLENNCTFINTIDDCVEQFRDLEILFINLASNTIINKYNKAIRNATIGNLGITINIREPRNEFHEVCKTEKLSQSKYHLKSAAQLNTALELFEHGKRCLMTFGFKTNNDFMLNKIIPNPDFNMNLVGFVTNQQTCFGDGLKISDNLNEILQREEITSEIINRAVLSIN